MKSLLFVFIVLIGSAHAESIDFTDALGFSVQNSCLEKFGPELPAIMRKGFDRGLQCLKDLGTNISLKNYQALLDLTTSGELEIGCSEPESNFNKTALAHGSITAANDVPSANLRHPFFSINPNVNMQEMTPAFLGQIAFHESFHNIGYIHGKTIEYAYACEECCFSEAGALKDNACRVCRSEYTGFEDEKYMADLTHYEDVSDFGNAFGMPMIVRKGLIKNPSSLIHRENLLVYDRYRQPLTWLSAKEWGLSQVSDVYAEVLATNFAIAFKDPNEFTLTAFKAREALYFEHDFTKAAQLFASLNMEEFKKYKIVNAEANDFEGKAVLNDMEILYQNGRAEYDAADVDKVFFELRKIGNR